MTKKRAAATKPGSGTISGLPGLDKNGDGELAADPSSIQVSKAFYQESACPCSAGIPHAVPSPGGS